MEKTGFEEVFFKIRKPLSLLLGGLTLIGLGVIIYKSSSFIDSSKVEFIKKSGGEVKDTGVLKEVVVEISGEVQKPGVYKLSDTSRVDDLLIAAGGLSVNADRDWVEKYVNRAAKIFDGQKVYIPRVGENVGAIIGVTTEGVTAVNTAENKIGGLININTASQSDLENLPGIGPVYAQNIIEGRIYSTVDELTSKGVLKRSVYEKIKDKITVN